MTLRWFLSATFRQATDMCKHVQKLLHSQRDILSPQAIAGLDDALQATRADLNHGADDATLRKRSGELEKAAAKWIKPYPNADWRENVEVFLVAIVVAMGVRTFFLQPFKIPTGSMQPTLYGIHGPGDNPTTEDMRGDLSFKVPGLFGRIFDLAVHGAIYHNIIAPADGQITRVEQKPHHFLGFINQQTIWVQYDGHSEETPLTVWCGPDDHLEHAAGFVPPYTFRKGEPIVLMEEITGDHLFVDRVTYNFRQPDRGEIVVFKTKGIDGLPQDEFYIKRLIGLPGDTVSIGADRHVRIDGRRLDASVPHFENVYGFDPGAPPHESQYSGHVLEPDDYRCHLRSPQDTLEVPPGHYVVFGDNTVNSWDSRYWGPLPQGNVIGKSFFVYWPITSRFGWCQR